MIDNWPYRSAVTLLRPRFASDGNSRRLPLLVRSEARLSCWTVQLKHFTERPFHLAIGILLLSGLFWSTLGWISNDENTKARNGPESHAGSNPQRDGNTLQEPVHSNARRGISYVIRACRQYDDSARLVACVVLRVILLRSVMLDIQCSWDGIEVRTTLCYQRKRCVTDEQQTFLPSLLLIHEAFNYTSSFSSSRTQTTAKTTRSYSLRYAFLVGVWTTSAFASITISGQRSTYICPLVGWWSRLIPAFQLVGVFLDGFIIIGLAQISKDAVESGRRYLLLGKLAFISAAVLGTIAGLFILKNPEHMVWSFHLESRAISDLLLASLLCSSFITSVVYLVGQLCPSIPIMVAGCAAMYTYHLAAQSIDFWPIPQRSSAVISVIAFVSTAAVLRFWREAARTQRSMSLNGTSTRMLMSLFILMSLIFLQQNFSILFRPRHWLQHPIDILISTAQDTSSQWQQRAAVSHSLEVAVLEYQSRYGIPPPPNFDKWYEFATSRGSLVLDTFDQINDDLLPFWAIEPAKIREMTGHMLERPWTEVGGLRIANGSTSIGPHVVPTHRWLLEGAASMIDKFSEWLPDIDLAININDESRVAVPWLMMEDLTSRAIPARNQLNATRNLQAFGANTLETWPGTFMAEEPVYSRDVPSEYFVEASISPSFTKYGVIGCPPDSMARTTSWWKKESFCSKCAAPHSLGPFLRNWTLSGSLCHQPDLENLHGFHLSPSSFKPTTSLFPIFSQSKIPGFSDILFPSPWNYEGKVIYNSSKDMKFSEKESTVFWRGATSEGFAAVQRWKGMQRQRFVHLANSTSKDTVLNLLLPSSPPRTDYQHHNIPLSEVLAATNISAAFVGEPVRCSGTDCAEQDRNLPFSQPVDFQDHWKYKYLVDLDGAGLSGRFLPFIESQSLVFRAASFRQWFEERLTPWKHFVPLDTRLHDFWGLMAYFGGLGQHGHNAHQVEAKRIAEDGQEWAARVLRKEDMEIYTFRLLLEWGRIVDDRRNELGFVLP